MKKPTPGFQWSDIDRARRTIRLEADDCPENSFTAGEYRGRYGLPLSTALYQLDKLVAQGRLKCGRKTVVNARGFRQVVRCFWMP